MMKSIQIIKDAWTGSFMDFVLGSIGTALFMASIIVIVLLGGGMI